MPTRFLRPCLALLAVLLSAFGVQRWTPSATLAADEDDRPCLGTIDVAPLAGGLALLPDDDGDLPPAWQMPDLPTQLQAVAMVTAPASVADVAPACELRRGSAGGARAP